MPKSELRHSAGLLYILYANGDFLRLLENCLGDFGFNIFRHNCILFMANSPYFVCSGSWICTNDLQPMKLASCYLLYPAMCGGLTPSDRVYADLVYGLRVLPVSGFFASNVYFHNLPSAEDHDSVTDTVAFSIRKPSHASSSGVRRTA